MTNNNHADAVKLLDGKRSARAVEERRKTLGVTAPPWTAEDEEYILSVSPTVAALELGRTVMAVRKRRQLVLKRQGVAA